MEKFQLGVLLVHGIGTQPPRDTLVRWGDALLNVIARATKHEVAVTVARASADSASDTAAEVGVDLRYGGRTERWLLAEGWWADCFPAPTYSELVSWSVRALPWSVALHIAQRYWQAEPNTSRTRKYWFGTKAILELLGAMALTPVFVAIFVLVLILGLLPIPQLRSLILSTQSTLIGTVGDSLVFVESPIRAALIRNRIIESLERLKERCERTVILAHSQGAAIAFDALGGIPQASDDDENSASAAAAPGGPAPDTLVTFGSGVNQLASLRFLSAQQREETFDTNPAYVAITSILAIIVSIFYLSLRIRSGSMTIWQLGEAGVVWSALLLITTALIWGSGWLIDTLTAHRWLAARADAADKTLRVWTIASIAILALGFFFFYSLFLRPHLPAMPVIALCIALVMLAASLTVILVANTKEMVTKSVREPPGVGRWVDVYASADPVPNGPTMLPVLTPGDDHSAKVESVRVWNRGAVLSDHTSYWENLDGFVLRIARVCAETAQSPWLVALPDETQVDSIDRLAKWRVAYLRWVVGINTLFWLFACSLLWWRYEARVPLPFKLPSSLPDWAPMVARSATLVGIIAAAALITATLCLLLWRRWVQAEQELILARKNPSDTGWATCGPMGMAMVISLLALVAWQLAQGQEIELMEVLMARWDDLVTGMIVGGFLFMVIANSRRPRLSGERASFRR